MLRAVMVQSLQACLAGPHVNLREGASNSAIVLAVDDGTATPRGPLRKLLQQVSFLSWSLCAT